jgi:urease beta subunit
VSEPGQNGEHQVSEDEIKQLPPPKTWDELINSRYLHSADLRVAQPEAKFFTRKVVEVLKESMADEKHPGEEKIQGVLRLEGEKKLLGLNTTNRLCMQAMFGNEVANAVGKRVTFKIEKVMAPEPGSRKRVEVDAIRIAGSPDIEKDVAFMLKLPRKKPVKTVLTMMKQRGAAAPTGAPAGAPGAAPVAPAKPPAAAPSTPEPPPAADPFA